MVIVAKFSEILQFFAQNQIKSLLDFESDRMLLIILERRGLLDEERQRKISLFKRASGCVILKRLKKSWEIEITVPNSEFLCLTVHPDVLFF